MLYDPKWEKKAEVRSPSMADFVAWLETKDPHQKYDFYSCSGDCLVDQYIQSFGHPTGVHHSEYLKYCKIVGGKNCQWSIPVICDYPNTFGGALERARATLAA